MLTGDHSGEPTLHHGDNIPEHRQIPLLVSGDRVVPGEIWPAPEAVDIVPTALNHSVVPDAWATGWYDPGYLTVIHYEAPGGFPLSPDPGPEDRGENYFAGGGVGYDTEISQIIDVETLALEIDGGVSYTLSAWLGGDYNQDDRARLVAEFLASDGTALGSAIVSAVDASDRGNVTSLLYVEVDGTVPQGTRQIKITLEAI